MVSLLDCRGQSWWSLVLRGWCLCSMVVMHTYLLRHMAGAVDDSTINIVVVIIIIIMSKFAHGRVLVSQNGAVIVVSCSSWSVVLLARRVSHFSWSVSRLDRRGQSSWSVVLRVSRYSWSS